MKEILSQSVASPLDSLLYRGNMTVQPLVALKKQQQQKNRLEVNFS